MSSYYSVVQYVPDVVRNERVNVGVVVFDDQQRKDAYFIEDFKRVRSIGGDPAFVKHAAHTIQQLGTNTLKRVIETWEDSIQFTKPAASLLDLTSLIVDSSNRFLVEEPAAQAPAPRTHADAVRLAKSELATALSQTIGKAGKKLIKRTYQIAGKFNRHNFDLAVANGNPVHIIEGLSFEGAETQKLENKAKAVAWSIDDVRQLAPDLPISIAILPPATASHGALYDEAVKAFTGLGARLVREPGMAQWAEDVAVQAKGHLPGN